MKITDYSELGITVEDHVAVMEIQRPPHNFFDFELISQLSAACEALGENDSCRTIVLCAAGKSFCAGANFGDGSGDQHQRDRQTGHLYQEAVRLFRTPKPIIAAVHGAAIGGGLAQILLKAKDLSFGHARNAGRARGSPSQAKF